MKTSGSRDNDANLPALQHSDACIKPTSSSPQRHNMPPLTSPTSIIVSALYPPPPSTVCQLTGAGTIQLVNPPHESHPTQCPEWTYAPPALPLSQAITIITQLRLILTSLGKSVKEQGGNSTPKQYFQTVDYCKGLLESTLIIKMQKLFCKSNILMLV